MSDAPSERVTPGESLVVLTRDAALVETLKALGSEHSVFTVGAEDAVRKWHYRPVQRDGHVVDQRARLRLKFALEN